MKSNFFKKSVSNDMVDVYVDKIDMNEHQLSGGPETIVKILLKDGDRIELKFTNLDKDMIDINNNVTIIQREKVFDKITEALIKKYGEKKVTYEDIEEGEILYCKFLGTTWYGRVFKLRKLRGEKVSFDDIKYPTLPNLKEKERDALVHWMIKCKDEDCVTLYLWIADYFYELSNSNEDNKIVESFLARSEFNKIRMEIFK